MTPAGRNPACSSATPPRSTCSSRIGHLHRRASPSPPSSCSSRSISPGAKGSRTAPRGAPAAGRGPGPARGRPRLGVTLWAGVSVTASGHVAGPTKAPFFLSPVLLPRRRGGAAVDRVRRSPLGAPPRRRPRAPPPRRALFRAASPSASGPRVRRRLRPAARPDPGHGSPSPRPARRLPAQRAGRPGSTPTEERRGRRAPLAQRRAPRSAPAPVERRARARRLRAVPGPARLADEGRAGGRGSREACRRRRPRGAFSGRAAHGPPRAALADLRRPPAGDAHRARGARRSRRALRGPARPPRA